MDTPDLKATQRSASMFAETLNKKKDFIKTNCICATVILPEVYLNIMLSFLSD